MKIKAYVIIPYGKSCEGRAYKSEKCKFYYDSARRCILFDEPIDSYHKCEKCKKAEVVK